MVVVIILQDIILICAMIPILYDIQSYLPSLTQQCKEGGCNLMVIHMKAETMAQATVCANYHTYSL